MGLLSGLLLASYFDVSPTTAWVAFLLLTVLHVFANWRAVSSLTLRTLNQNRCAVAVDAYISDLALDATGVAVRPAKDLSPEAVVLQEPLWPAAWWSYGFASSVLIALARLSAGVCSRRSMVSVKLKVLQFKLVRLQLHVCKFKLHIL